MFQALALLSRYHCRSLWRFANSVILTHLGAVFVPRQQPDTLRSPMVPLSMPLKLRFNITPNKLVQLNKLFARSVYTGQVRGRPVPPPRLAPFLCIVFDWLTSVSVVICRSYSSRI